MIALFIVISAHVSVARADTVVICRQDRKSVGRLVGRLVRMLTKSRRHLALAAGRPAGRPPRSSLIAAVE